MTTARDWEHGDRPTCNACGCKLDLETDTHHDGYRGSPHAHGGRGSYGLGSHHYVFSELCESCREFRAAPLRRILSYDYSLEWLECGHQQATPHNLWGAVRPGEKRRCEDCRLAHPQDFDPVAHEMSLPPTYMERVEAERFAKAQAVYNCDEH